jgi:hypothetical protein
MTEDLTVNGMVTVTIAQVEVGHRTGRFCDVFGAGRFAFIVADVSGHSVAAALYTVHLDAMWFSRRRA